MSEGAKVAVGRGAIGKEVKHGGLIAGVESVEERAAAGFLRVECLGPELFLMAAP